MHQTALRYGWVFKSMRREAIYICNECPVRYLTVFMITGALGTPPVAWLHLLFFAYESEQPIFSSPSSINAIPN